MANKTMTRKLVKKNSKPEVKYDNWMMGRLKKNKKCAVFSQVGRKLQI